MAFVPCLGVVAKAASQAVQSNPTRLEGNLGWVPQVTTKHLAIAGAVVAGVATTGYVCRAAFSKILRWWRVDYKVTFKSVEPDGDGHIRVESMRVGSTETSGGFPPSFQAPCGVFEGDNFISYGSVIRFGEDVMGVPLHVLAHAKYVYRNNYYWPLPPVDEQCMYIGNDYICFIVKPAVFSRLGMSKPSIGFVRDTGSSVRIVAPNGNTTYGTLLNDSNLWGNVVYSGTTTPGYSGAAYTSSNQLLAVHLHGGQVNGGINASYVWCMVQSQRKQDAEDSAEWLLSLQQTRGSAIHYDYGYLDHVQVRVDGRYHLIALDRLTAENRRLMSRSNHDQFDDRESGIMDIPKLPMVPTTVVPVTSTTAAPIAGSGEGRDSSPSLGGSSLKATKGKSELQSLQSSMDRLRARLEKLERSFQLKKKSKEPQPSTSGQVN